MAHRGCHDLPHASDCIAGAKAKGEVRLDEGEIDIPGLERTAVTRLGRLAALMTKAPTCRWPRTAAI